MKTRVGITLVIAAASAAALAQREPHPKPDAQPVDRSAPAEDIGKPIGAPESGFALMDSNQDRKISREEAGAGLELSDRFGEFDADKDGSLSPSEYEAFGSR